MFEFLTDVFRANYSIRRSLPTKNPAVQNKCNSTLNSLREEAMVDRDIPKLIDLDGNAKDQGWQFLCQVSLQKWLIVMVITISCELQKWNVYHQASP